MIYAALAKRVGDLVAKLILAGIAILLVVGLYFAVKTYFTAGLETQVKVGAGQLGAQGESGHDAVQALGNTVAHEQATDKITQENGNAIDHAKGSDVAIDPAARAAGLHALCRRESYRRAHPACVQQSAP